MVESTGSATPRHERWPLLYKLNSRAWSGELQNHKSSTLDSSLKKNTALIKRFRTGLTADNLVLIRKEFESVSLEKYLSEAVSAIVEGSSKCRTQADIGAAAEIISLILQRFGSECICTIAAVFAKGLAKPPATYLNSLAPPEREREEVSRLTRQRILIRLVTELWIIGVLRTMDDAYQGIPVQDRPKPAKKSHSGDGAGSADPYPLFVLKDLLLEDKDCTNITLVSILIKNYGEYILAKPDSESDTAMEIRLEDGSPLLSLTVRRRFYSLFKTYLDKAIRFTQNKHENLKDQEKRMQHAALNRGEISENRKAMAEQLSRQIEKLRSTCQSLSNALGVELPPLESTEDLAEAEDDSNNMVRGVGSSMGPRTEQSALWDDEEQRRFYENLLDVSSVVASDKGPTTEASEASKEGEGPPEENDITDMDISDDEHELNPSDDAEAPKSSAGAQVDAYLMRLPESNNRDRIDKAALDFCFINSKASQNRLIKFLCSTPQDRLDLIPYYSRLAATLNQVMPDVGAKLAEYFLKQFKRLLHRKDSKDYQARSKVLLFISELTKFKVFPSHIILFCLKASLDDFTHYAIELTSQILEFCGKFLIKYPDTKERAMSLLEVLKKKMSSSHISSQDQVVLESAYFYVVPPPLASIQRHEITPQELFVRKLIYSDLSKSNYVKILKLLRKQNWKDRTVFDYNHDIFLSIWKVKFSNIYLMALLVGGLASYHSEFTVLLVDSIIEMTREGLEKNDYRDNQRRTSLVKYLGELCNYKVIDINLVFETLNLLLHYGRETNSAASQNATSGDFAGDYFRIRLINVLLSSCGSTCDRGSHKTRLDGFLLEYRCYAFGKEPLPLEVHFETQDVFVSLRPKWDSVTTLEQAKSNLESWISQNEIKNTHGVDESNSDDSSEDMEGKSVEGLSDDGGEDGDNGVDSDDGSEQSMHDGRSDTSGSSESDIEENEDFQMREKERQREQEEMADFEREFSKMMSESLDSRKMEKATRFDVGLPIKRHQSGQSADFDSSNKDPDEEGRPRVPSDDKVKFTFLSRKGNRPQARGFNIPSDSSLATTSRDMKEAERKEREKMKNLVLNYEKMEEERERKQLQSSAANHGVKLSFRHDNDRTRPKH